MVYQYVYHVKGEKIVSDRVYKVLRTALLWDWEDITHPLIKLLDKEDVMVDIKFSSHGPSYPQSLITGANLYLKEFLTRKEM